MPITPVSACSPHMSAGLSTGPGGRQEPGTECPCLTWLGGTAVLGPACASCFLSTKLEFSCGNSPCVGHSAGHSRPGPHPSPRSCDGSCPSPLLSVCGLLAGCWNTGCICHVRVSSLVCDDHLSQSWVRWLERGLCCDVRFPVLRVPTSL